MTEDESLLNIVSFSVIAGMLMLLAIWAFLYAYGYGIEWPSLSRFASRFSSRNSSESPVTTAQDAESPTGLKSTEPASFASSFPVAESSPVAKEEEMEPAEPLGAIGYKYANIGRDGFIGLARGKSYRVNSTVDSTAMGFHSYKSLELLRLNSSSSAYHNRGVLLMEVLHYGEVTEYQDGWVSTGQRVLQVAQDNGLCSGIVERNGGTFYCSSQPEFEVMYRGQSTERFCRPHYARAMRSNRFFPGKRVINIQQWLAKFKDSPAARRVKVNLGLEELVPTGSKPKRSSGLRWR